MLKMIKMQRNFSVLEGFENFKTVCLVKGLSSETIRWYNESLKYFSRFFDLQNNISDVTEDIITKYIVFCLNNKNKITTINTRLTALKSFFNWAYEEHLIRKIKIKLLKHTVKVKDTYTIDELEKLLKKPNLKKCDFTEYRDWVISNFFISLAPRVSTLVNIKIKDLDLKYGEVIFTHMKTKRQQVLPLTKYMINILKEYLSFRKGDKEDFLFCSRYGQPLTKNALRISLNKYNKRRNVNRTGRHIYRNTFAKLWILNHGDAFRLQKILGHSTIEMTKRYIEMYSDDLKANMEELNPIYFIIKNEKKEISMKKK